MSKVSIITQMTNAYNLHKSSDILTIEMIRDFLAKMKRYTKEELQIIQYIALDMVNRKVDGISLLSLAHYYARALEKIHTDKGVPHKQLVKECYQVIKMKL